jgi:hypothetical protein
MAYIRTRHSKLCRIVRYESVVSAGVVRSECHVHETLGRRERFRTQCARQSGELRSGRVSTVVHTHDIVVVLCVEWPDNKSHNLRTNSISSN